MFDPQEVPPEAHARIAQIEAHLREAQPLLRTAPQSADTFAIQETQARYLPETIELYLAVPLSLRAVINENGESALTQLLASLAILENATATHLRNLAAAQRVAADVNQHFLSERFSGLTPSEQDPAVLGPIPADDYQSPATPPVTFFVEALFSRAAHEAAGDDQQLLDAIAGKFETAFPQLTKVERPLFSRRAKRITLDVPSPQGATRYSLAITSFGFEASAAMVVRGIPLKTTVLSTDAWISQCTARLADFAVHNQAAKTRLQELFGSR